MPPRTLSGLALNRATLARQGLLAPITDGSIADAVAGVGSLQAQHPEWPPIALWSRAGDRAIAGLPNALADHSVVRAALMRITVHVVAAHDFWPMSMLTQPLRRLQFRSFFKADPIDSPLGRQLQDGLGTVRDALADHPLRIRDMDAIMRGAVPKLADHPNRIYWRYVACTLPLVHVPFEGEGYGRSRYGLAEQYLGPPPGDLDEAAALRHLAVRYLGAFGPAGIDDLMSYTGRRGTATHWQRTMGELGDRIEHFVDDGGRKLFDLADAPRPSAGHDAPPRLLARWDSLLLSHATGRRQRIIADEHRAAVYTRNADVLPTILVDGMVAGTWDMDRAESGARIMLRSFGRLRPETELALEAEARRLVALLAPASDSQSVILERM